MHRTWLIPLLILISSAAQAKNQAHDRKLWAYPRGVIVSSTISGSGLRDQKLLRKDIEAFDALAQKELERCAAEARTKFPDAATRSRRYRFDLKFNLSLDGEASAAELDRQSGESELLPCFAPVTTKAEDFNFSPYKSRKPLKIRVAYEIVLLTDEDAQGRGYQYLQGEERWEKTLAAHPQWLSCKSNEECTVSAASCEPQAINKIHLEAYSQAASQRAKTACRGKTNEAALPQALCRQRRCALNPIQ